MSEWKSIDSAPKDGALFLSFDRWTGVSIARWGSHYLRGPDGDKYGWVHALGPAGNTASPTHWQPLPEPPNDNP